TSPTPLPPRWTLSWSERWTTLAPSTPTSPSPAPSLSPGTTRSSAPPSSLAPALPPVVTVLWTSRAASRSLMLPHSQSSPATCSMPRPLSGTSLESSTSRPLATPSRISTSTRTSLSM
ncbi:hypothetical protein BG015_006544, partial [Linnemannia schmuckeri]